MLNELLIVCKSKTHVEIFNNEANQFLGLSFDRESQTGLCKTNIWEII